MKKMRNNRGGFSLLEVLIVVVIAVVLVFIVASTGSNINLLNGVVNQGFQARSGVSQALQIMAAEIQSAEPSAAGAFPIDSAGTSSFTFFTNVGANSSTARVRFYLASSTIWQGVTQPTGTPAGYVTSTEVDTALVNNVIIATGTSLFSYYDTNYTGTQPAMTSTADVSQIRLVDITFLTTTTSTQAVQPQYFSSLVDLRILHSND